MDSLGRRIRLRHRARVARILCSTVAVLAGVLFGGTVRAQQGPAISGVQSRPPLFVGLRAQMKHIREMQAQELAGEIGPPPADCRVTVNHNEDDELGEALAEFVFDVFRRAYWTVEVAAGEQLTSATSDILIDFSPATADAAAKLQAVLSQRQHTVIAPIMIDAALSCRLRVTIGPQ